MIRGLKEESIFIKQNYLERVDILGLTKSQIENVQIDYGIIYTNYGELDAKKLGPVRGGGEFGVEQTLRDIEYDGSKGKTKGMQVVDDVSAKLTVVVLDTSIETMSLAMPYATLNGDGEITPYTLTCKSEDIGVIDTESYLKNVTMFAKTVKGEYRKITLYNAMNESNFTLAAKPKGEGEISLEIYAHWDAEDDTKDLYKIETVGSIA